MATDGQYDVIVIGGGPSGATAALVLARSGVRVVVIEKAQFPRFQIGESFLPANFKLMERLELTEKLAALPHARKLGAEFVMGDATESSRFEFSRGLVGGRNETMNIARAEFDRWLLDEAREAGAEIRMPEAVRRIAALEDGAVGVETDRGDVRARYLLDASGQATVVARHLGTRRAMSEPYLRKAAYFEHFHGVGRLEGEEAGFPTVAMCDEGWFWSIPLDDETTSVGLVIEPHIAREHGVAAARMLRWGIERCPFVRERMTHATGPTENRVCADFSYSCRPYSGPGYFLLGDAASFFDPVFSTGVNVGMESAVEAARLVSDVLAGRRSPQRARRRYNRYFSRMARIFLGVIRHFYDHSFRELFLAGRGPLEIERGVLTVLAGYVNPRTPFSAAWRYRLFELFIRIQRHWALVPRRRRFSLLASDPARVAADAPTATSSVGA